MIAAVDESEEAAPGFGRVGGLRSGFQIGGARARSATRRGVVSGRLAVVRRPNGDNRERAARPLPYGLPGTVRIIGPRWQQAIEMFDEPALVAEKGRGCPPVAGHVRARVLGCVGFVLDAGEGALSEIAWREGSRGLLWSRCSRSASAPREG